MLPIHRPWFFAPPVADIPAGIRSIAALPHRRTAVVSIGRTTAVAAMSRTAAMDLGRTAILADHRRTVEVAR